MELLLFLVADYASVDASGKLNVLGAFNRIWSDEFPTTLHSMYVVTRLGAEPGEFDIQRTLAIRFLDEDASELGGMEIDFQVDRPNTPGRAEFNAILEIRDLALPRQGRYEFRVYVDSDHKGVFSIEASKRDGAETEN